MEPSIVPCVNEKGVLIVNTELLLSVPLKYISYLNLIKGWLNTGSVLTKQQDVRALYGT